MDPTKKLRRLSVALVLACAAISGCTDRATAPSPRRAVVSTHGSNFVVACENTDWFMNEDEYKACWYPFDYGGGMYSALWGESLSWGWGPNLSYQDQATCLQMGESLRELLAAGKVGVWNGYNPSVPNQVGATRFAGGTGNVSKVMARTDYVDDWLTWAHEAYHAAFGLGTDDAEAERMGRACTGN